MGSSKLNELIRPHEENIENKNLLCVDDFQGNSKVGEIASDYFNNLTKYNVNIIYIVQRFMTVPKDVRSNANFIIGFTQPKDDLDWFYNNVISRYMDKELPWPSGYELQLSLKRSRVLILVKVIGGRQEGHPVQKCSLLQQSPN